ncbi:MAG: hypothetical protein GEU90_04280 [Gemmatimonas sp.]|nr:hypothetical protein [Gemmatimonas sp.]
MAVPTIAALLFGLHLIRSFLRTFLVDVFTSFLAHSSQHMRLDQRHHLAGAVPSALAIRRRVEAGRRQAAWEGWLTRSNGWSVRESIFHHFWYDAAVVTAALLTQERDAELRIAFPVIRPLESERR